MKDRTADVARALANEIESENQQCASRNFTATLIISRSKFQIVRRSLKAGEARMIGGVGFNRWRSEIIITPRATERGLGLIFISLLQQQRLTADQIMDADGERYDLLMLEFSGRNMQRFENVWIHGEMFSPRSNVGAWFEYVGGLRITPWATLEDIGVALIDTIAHFAPNQERWIQPGISPAALHVPERLLASRAALKLLTSEGA